MDKLVFVKELRSPTTKSGSTYTQILDQDNKTWNLFKDFGFIELQKSYLVNFEMNDKGFEDVKKITPLVNVFQQKALKEIASRNDIVRNLSTCVSYSKDMVIGGVLEMSALYDKAMEMNNWIQKNADELMPKLEE